VGEQGDQGQVPAALPGASCPASAGGLEQPAELFTVKPGGRRVLADAGSADVGDRRAGEQALLEGIGVEAGERCQPPGERRRRQGAHLSQFAGVGVHVRTLGVQHLNAMAVQPLKPVGQVPRVGGAGVALVAE
jgi:hypothetical protein